MIRKVIFNIALCCLAVVPKLCADVTLYTNYLGASNVTGNSNSAPGFPSSSWQESGTSKSELYIPVSLLFSGTVTIDDVQSITYWTNKPGAYTSPDWTLLIYTNLQASGNEASWYHSRLNAEPYFTNSVTDVANTWHEWSTDSPNALTFYDAGRSGNFGTYTDPTLADYQTNSYNGNNYGTESIEYFSLQTGSAWANGFTGLVDGLTITLKDGTVENVNLEATPEPSSVLLLATVMFGAVGMLKRSTHSRRTKKQQLLRG